MFALKRILNGRINAPEPLLLPTKAGEAYTAGEALKVSAGALTKASGDVSALYIGAENYTAPAGGGRPLACYRITGDMLFEAPLTALGNTQKVGARLTLSSDGLGVTATAASAGFGAEIVSLKDSTARVFLK